MHVQGLSHWAPANIGPYSQCVKVRFLRLDLTKADVECTTENLSSSAVVLHLESFVQVDDNVFVAGQIAMVPANLSLIEGGILPESRLSLRHVTRILQAMQAGSALQDLTLVVCYVTSQSYIKVAAAEWKAALEKCRVGKCSTFLRSFMFCE